MNNVMDNIRSLLYVITNKFQYEDLGYYVHAKM